MRAQLNKVERKKLELNNGNIMFFMVVDMMIPGIGYVENVYINKDNVKIPDKFDDEKTVYGYKCDDIIEFTPLIKIKNHKFKVELTEVHKC